MCGAVCFQFTDLSCDDWENIYTLSYYHQQIESMNYHPLFRVRSWNNGVRCMSIYILMVWYDLTYDMTCCNLHIWYPLYLPGTMSWLLYGASLCCFQVLQMTAAIMTLSLYSPLVSWGSPKFPDKKCRKTHKHHRKVRSKHHISCYIALSIMKLNKPLSISRYNLYKYT